MKKVNKEIKKSVDKKQSKSTSKSFNPKSDKVYQKKYFKVGDNCFQVQFSKNMVIEMGINSDGTLSISLINTNYKVIVLGKKISLNNFIDAFDNFKLNRDWLEVLANGVNDLRGEIARYSDEKFKKQTSAPKPTPKPATKAKKSSKK